MKTPMQELIEQLKRLKYSEINEQAWDAYDSVMDIAEALLEKEKEMMWEGAFNTGAKWARDRMMEAFEPIVKEAYTDSFMKSFDVCSGGFSRTEVNQRAIEQASEYWEQLKERMR